MPVKEQDDRMRIVPGDFADPQVQALLRYHVSEARISSPPRHKLRPRLVSLADPGDRVLRRLA